MLNFLADFGAIFDKNLILLILSIFPMSFAYQMQFDFTSYFFNSYVFKQN